MVAPKAYVSSQGGVTLALRLACLGSGAAALVFENVWFRAAGLVLGNSVWSAAVVTAAFMAGLGLGNLIVATLYRKIRNVGLAYVGVELAIAVSGLTCFLLLYRGQAALANLLAPWQESPLVLQAVRSVIALVVLIGPAVAIGATLPLLVGIQTRQAFGVRLAELYAWNTLGAVGGSLACEFFLIGALGLTGTAVAAGAGNVLAAGFVYFLCGQGASPAAGSEPAVQVVVAPTAAAGLGASGRYRLLGAVALSGLNLLALEVLWFRFLQLFFNGTTKTFALMLALVLAGLALGGAMAARLARAGSQRRLVPYLCLASGGLVVLTYAAFPHVQAVVGGGGTRALVVLAAFLMVPLCAISGALFALMGEALNDYLRHAVHSTGLLTLANTTGAMAGPLLAAFVFLPVLGIERAFFLIAVLYGVAAILVRGLGGEPVRPGLRRFLPLGGFGLVLACFPFGLMEHTYYQGVARRVPGATLVQVNEGVSETSFYLRQDAMGRPFFHRLVTHGYSMSASDPRSKRYMKMFAWLPLALNPDSRSALLICFGVGSTARALADTPWLQRIDVVDISRDILNSSGLIFPPPASDPLRDPRVTTHVEDGRFFLQTTRHTYDLITGEPPPTKIAGVVNLYTEEFFRLVRARLNEGGFCSYWLPVYQMQPREARSIIRAFLNVFPEGTLWEGGGLNWILLGRRGAGPRPSSERFAQQWSNPGIAAELASLGLEAPGQLGASFLADAPALARFCGDAPALTDSHPQRISTEMRDRAPEAPEFRALVDPVQARAIFEASAWIAGALPAEMRAAAGPFFPVQGFLNYALYPLYRPEVSAIARDIRDVLGTTALRTLPLLMVGSSPQELAIARELARTGTSGAEIEFHQAAGSLADRDYPRAREHLRASIRRNMDGSSPPVDVLTLALSGL